MLVDMKNTLLKSLLIPALTFSITADAGLYKGLDDEGNVLYSDKPFDQAQKITPPALTIMDAPKVAPKAEASEEEAATETVYTSFSILSPKNVETIWNQPDLNVTLQLKPKLDTTNGHSIWLLLDGKPHVKNSQSLSIPVGRIDRGTHSLQAQVRNKAGKLIKRTGGITVFIKNSVAAKQ